MKWRLICNSGFWFLFFNLQLWLDFSCYSLHNDYIIIFLIFNFSCLNRLTFNPFDNRLRFAPFIHHWIVFLNLRIDESTTSSQSNQCQPNSCNHISNFIFHCRFSFFNFRLCICIYHIWFYLSSTNFNFHFGIVNINSDFRISFSTYIYNLESHFSFSKSCIHIYLYTYPLSSAYTFTYSYADTSTSSCT